MTLTARVEHVEKELGDIQGLLGAIAERLGVGETTPVSVPEDPEQGWDWNEDPDPVLLSAVPNIEEPDRPPLPNFPRPFSVDAPPAPPRTTVTDGVELEPISEQTPLGVTSGKGDGWEYQPEQIARDYQQHLRQFRVFPDSALRV